MKTYSLSLKALIILLVINTGTLIAQGGGRLQEKKDEIESMKIAFITKKLALSSEEAQQFWPVYNQYSEKLQELRKKRRQDYRQNKDNIDEMSDKEVEAAVENDMLFRQKELDLQKEYHTKFKSVLPIKKVAKLYAAEEQFKRVLLEKLKDKGAAKGR
jgi:shikimate kinase